MVTASRRLTTVLMAGALTTAFASRSALAQAPLRVPADRRVSAPILLPSPIATVSHEAASSSAVVEVGGTCELGCCQIVHRDRPRGCKKRKRRIMLNNRTSEPEWYRYYRCHFYGHHPTQWRAWPTGWMACRGPILDPHPYDIKQPDQERPPIREDSPLSPPPRVDSVRPQGPPETDSSMP